MKDDVTVSQPSAVSYLASRWVWSLFCLNHFFFGRDDDDDDDDYHLIKLYGAIAELYTALLYMYIYM